MSEPWSEAPTAPQQTTPAPAAAPMSLLEQMQRLLADLNADLAGLDADLQSSADRAEARRRPDDLSTDAAARG